MKLEEEGCECTNLEIKEGSPKGCTLNQIIKCHGDQPINDILKHIQIKEKK